MPLSKQHLSKLWIGLGLFTTCIGLMCAAWIHVQVIRLSYEIQKANKQKTAIKQELDGVNQEFNRITSISRLDEMSKTKFGLSVPASSQIIVLEK